jgi:hypothetical protein
VLGIETGSLVGTSLWISFIDGISLVMMVGLLLGNSLSVSLDPNVPSGMAFDDGVWLGLASVALTVGLMLGLELETSLWTIVEIAVGPLEFNIVGLSLGLLLTPEVGGTVGLDSGLELVPSVGRPVSSSISLSDVTNVLGLLVGLTLEESLGLWLVTSTGIVVGRSLELSSTSMVGLSDTTSLALSLGT